MTLPLRQRPREIQALPRPQPSVIDRKFTETEDESEVALARFKISHGCHSVIS